MPFRALRLFLLSLLVAVSHHHPVKAASGDPDLAFGPGAEGGTTFYTRFGDGTAGSIVQADGKIIVAGRFGDQVALVRYLPNGFLDSQFADRGISVISTFVELYPSAVRQQLDGKIVVLASTPNQEPREAWLIRFNPDGSLDPTFGQNGQAPTYPAAVSLDFQPGGKIVVTGTHDGRFSAHRFMPDGSSDASFGTDGSVFVLFSAENCALPNRILALPDGRLLLAGRNGDDLALARLTEAGALDETFGTGGKVAFRIADTATEARALAFLPDGRFLVGGSVAGEDAILLRFTENGSLDSSFGTHGVVRVNLEDGLSTWEGINAISSTSSGKIVVAGYYDFSNLACARFEADGAPDLTFGSGGVATFSVLGQTADGFHVLPDDSILAANAFVGFGLTKLNSGGGMDRSFAGTGRITEAVEDHVGGGLNYVHALPDGRIYSSAFNQTQSAFQRLVFRYLPDGSPDLSFGTNGRLVTPLFGATAFADDGRFYLSGRLEEGQAGKVTISRHLPDGSPDLAFGTAGETTAQLGAGDVQIGQLCIDSKGRVVAIATVDTGQSIVVMRLLANGRFDPTFHQDGKLTVPARYPSASIGGAVQEDGKILLAQADGGTMRLTRWTARGELDSTFGEAGYATLSAPDSRFLPTVRIAPDGKLVIGKTAQDSSGALMEMMRCHSNGWPDLAFGEAGVTNLPLGADNYLMDFQVERDGKIVILTSGYHDVDLGVRLTRLTSLGELDPTFGIAGVSTIRYDGNHYSGMALAFEAHGKLLVGGTAWNGHDQRVFVARVEGDTFARPARSVSSITHFVGDVVAGASEPLTYGNFSAARPELFAGSVQSGSVKTPAIFAEDGSVLLSKGTIVPGLPGNPKIASFREPQGRALIATLQGNSGNVAPSNAAVLLTNLHSGSIQVAARAGVPLPGLPPGVTIRGFLTAAQDADTPVFLASLSGLGVNARNRIALCVASPLGAIRILARTGDSWNGRVIRAITTLLPAPSSRAHDRWRNADAILARLKFVGGGEAIAHLPIAAASAAEWTASFGTGPSPGIPALNGASIQRFGLADLSPDGTTAVLATLRHARVPRLSRAILVHRENLCSLLVRTGDLVGKDGNGNDWPNVTVRSLGDPLLGTGSQIVFPVALSNGATGIGYSLDAVNWSLLANSGALAPGGGAWNSFQSLVLPKQVTGGPIFVAGLRLNPDTNIDATCDRGIWAVTSSGSLKAILREGDAPHGVAIRTFTALNPSTGASTGFNLGTVVPVIAQLATRRPARLEISIP